MRVYTFCLLIITFVSCNSEQSQIYPIKVHHGLSIMTIGGNLCSRMAYHDYFQAYLHASHPDQNIVFRNMCDGGDTPGFRPHSGRDTPWAFKEAEKYQSEYANASESEGFLAYPDEWLTRFKADVILAFFGYSESFDGIDSLSKYEAELEAFIEHTKTQKYNGKNAPKLILISPIAFENIASNQKIKFPADHNNNLEAYTKMMSGIAKKNNIDFIDAYHASLVWMKGNNDITIDGAQLNDDGYKLFSSFLMEKIFGVDVKPLPIDKNLIKEVEDKNWYWTNLFKIPNGVHIFGRRYNPFGQDNYPYELKKLDELITIRDSAIWSIVANRAYDKSAADAKTTQIPDIKTNYIPIKGQMPRYLYGDEALSKFKLAPGFKIELFASEKEFPDLANPVQMSFDSRGRLWVSVLPSYPHYRVGDARPNDKILILEDTNSDGKADKQTVFADKLHLPTGFELAAEGVYVSQGEHLKLLVDTDHDDHADKVEILLSGFDDHDTHHAISAFSADPSGAIVMEEGTFLHSNVETIHGTVRATNGGFFRYNPSLKHLERTAQIGIPNPWGVTYDDWGQDFFLETSNPDVRWLMPSTIKPVYGVEAPKSAALIEDAHRVRPTSGIELVSSRHFPDSMQSDLLLNNTIGYLGTKQHVFEESETGYKTKHRQDLIQSSDPNYRPVDLEFAPDGSLYIVDWHNVLIGHMQHNVRDPLRDHVHGRIYRITCTDRPLVKQAQIHDATIGQLLDNLKLPEYRTRYRTRRELRGRPQMEVSQAIQSWQKNLDKSDKKYEHHLLEALWVSWGINKLDQNIVSILSRSQDHRIRAALVRVIRYMHHQIPNYKDLLIKMANDTHGRVRLETIVAASWLDKNTALQILSAVEKKPMDTWMKPSFDAVKKNFLTRVKSNDSTLSQNDIVSGLKGDDLKKLQLGRKLYSKEGNCATCHQQNGRGVVASEFPPLANSEWIKDEAKLIKLTLNGIMGPITVSGKKYSGKVPMIPYRDLLSDDEIAAILTYVRRSWGNREAPIDVALVKKIRSETVKKKGYYLSKEL